jgi:hypothetical protein
MRADEAQPAGDKYTIAIEPDCFLHFSATFLASTTLSR